MDFIILPTIVYCRTEKESYWEFGWMSWILTKRDIFDENDTLEYYFFLLPMLSIITENGQNKLLFGWFESLKEIDL